MNVFCWVLVDMVLMVKLVIDIVVLVVIRCKLLEFGKLYLGVLEFYYDFGGSFGLLLYVELYVVSSVCI